MNVEYRVTLADSVYHTRDNLAEAQSDALDYARILTKAMQKPVRVTVHETGGGDRGESYVGSARGLIEHRQTFVRWIPAPKGALFGGEATGGPVRLRT